MRSRLYPVILLVLAVAAAVLIWHGGAARVSASSVQPDGAILALLPVQSTALFGLDFDGLRSTAIYGKWSQIQAQKHDQEYDDFVAQTGFDPLRDVQAVTGAQWKDGDEVRALVVVTARYDPAKVAGYLKQHKEITTTLYRDVELFGPAEEHAGNDHGAFAFLDDRTIIAGNQAAVQQAIDQKLNAGQNVMANQALMLRLGQVPVENQLWAVTTAPGSLMRGHMPGQVGQAKVGEILGRLQASTFAVNASADVRMVAQADCADANDAHTLAEAARGILAMVRLMAPANQPHAVEVLNTFQIVEQGQQVTVRAQIPAALLDEMASAPGNFLMHDSHPKVQHQ